MTIPPEHPAAATLGKQLAALLDAPDGNTWVIQEIGYRPAPQQG